MKAGMSLYANKTQTICMTILPVVKKNVLFLHLSSVELTSHSPRQTLRGTAVQDNALQHQPCMANEWFWHHCPKAIVTWHDSVAFSPCSHAGAAVFILQALWVQLAEVGNYSERYTALLFLGTGLGFSMFLVCFVVAEIASGTEEQQTKGVARGKSRRRCVQTMHPWQC